METIFSYDDGDMRLEVMNDDEDKAQLTFKITDQMTDRSMSAEFDWFKVEMMVEKMTEWLRE